MSEFEQDLANVMGSFIETELDCVYKQNEEIEQLKKEKQQYKEVIEEVRKKLKLERKIALSLKHPYTVSNIDEVLQILDKVGD